VLQKCDSLESTLSHVSDVGSVGLMCEKVVDDCCACRSLLISMVCAILSGSGMGVHRLREKSLFQPSQIISLSRSCKSEITKDSNSEALQLLGCVYKMI
jgi:hypothetical protein